MQLYLKHTKPTQLVTYENFENKRVSVLKSLNNYSDSEWGAESEHQRWEYMFPCPPKQMK